MPSLEQLLSGDLSDAARVWSALAPLLLLSTYFLGGVPVYAWLRRHRKVGIDAEMATRGDSLLLGQGLRQYFIWVIQPLWRLVRATGLPADAVTTLSMLVSMASGVAMAGGRFALGGWLYIFSGILDVIDGRLARASGTQSRAGAALDSVLDRYADAAVLGGLAWYYRDSWVLALALAALVGSLLTSYIRAKGEGLGVSMKVGAIQRAERIFALGVSTAFAPIAAVAYEAPSAHPMHWVAVGGLALLALSSQWTAAHRLVFLLQRLRSEQGTQRPAMLSLGRDGLPRSLVASGLATAADFGVVLALVEGPGMSPWLATALGCGLGAVVSFLLGRYWAFSRSDQGALPQAGRYAFVSGTSLGLNAGGVAVWQLLPVDYRVAWWITRGLVFALWNFPLHRDYVFGGPTGSAPASADAGPGKLPAGLRAR
ncbi:MAG: GtrA family protein [Myxococcales bacterium]|nr:GtrA family protein [Myxococcales bacterium]